MGFWIMFALGVVSSLHCVQMCGPIVIAYTSASGFVAQSSCAPKAAPLSQLPQHLAYNVGRILIYTMLGVLAGLFGNSIQLVGRLAGISSAAIIVSGTLMIIAGILMFGSFQATSRLGNWSIRVTSQILRPVRNLISSGNVVDRFYLGLVLGFLPCGLVYMALLRSVAAGTALGGAFSMLAFGLGTAGALIVLGYFSSAIKLRLNRFGSRVAAGSVIALGVFLILRSAHAANSFTAMQACHGHH